MKNNAKTLLNIWSSTLKGKNAKGVPIVTEGPVRTKTINQTLKLTKNRLQQKLAELQSDEPNHESVAPLSCAKSTWSVAERLTRRFGFGQCRRTREEFYRKLEAIVEQNGEPALRIISDCVYAAEKANRPGNYFCASVVRRLKENGFEFQRNENDW